MYVNLSKGIIAIVIVILIGIAMVYFYEGDAKLIGLLITLVAEFILVRSMYQYRRK